MAVATGLSLEFARFYRHSRYLNRILKQTISTLIEIKRSGKFYEEQLNSVEFSQEELHKIRDVIDRSPKIILLGQNSYAKACVVNELFSQPVLPLAETPDFPSNWRTLCFTYGIRNELSLILPESYELVTQSQLEGNLWTTVPQAELELQVAAVDDYVHDSAVLEIRFCHPLLKDGLQVVVSPSNIGDKFQDFIQKHAESALPLIIYAIGEDILYQQDIQQLQELKNLLPTVPVLFIQTHLRANSDLTESEQHVKYELEVCKKYINLHSSVSSVANIKTDINLPLVIFQQLCDLGYLSALPVGNSSSRSRAIHHENPESEYIEFFENVKNMVTYVRHILQLFIISTTVILNTVHARCLQMFILSAFNMTRDMMITPKRIEYAREKENDLFTSLMDIASHKQDEIKDLIVETIVKLKYELLEKAAEHQFIDVEVPASGVLNSARDFKICTGEIQDLIISAVNKAVANRLIESVEYLRESYVGTLQRCLQNLENACNDDCDSHQASNALKQVLNAAYQIEVTSRTSSSFMRAMWEKMKQLMQSMPWKTPQRIDAKWKKKVAAEMISSLSESRLSRSICSQFRDKLKHSHELFSACLRQLEAHHSGRLEKTEEQRLKVRKTLAPKIARYYLESTSLQDMLLYGMPSLGREIGRGQYGVVYSCESWARFSPCALKSVVPPDEKHWNDLAMEFYYTRSIPEHSRVVAIRGSVIDHSYGNGSSPAVLLIMDRLQRDLHTAIKNGLGWMIRLQIAVDVVQGIRYLHSQGLIHRDIKLKNVLMDKRNRAKITDLGFCKPEAMMSGSIVGTPIHMAPELFTGRYDSTVDVYAFGILFWYICAGSVRLPYVYEQCLNKDQLWMAVKKGNRPEKLTIFDDNCWNLMEECWSGEPALRPFLGNVEQRLMAIKKFYENQPPPGDEMEQMAECMSTFSSSPYVNIDFIPP